MIKQNLEAIKSRMKKRNLDWVWLNVGEEGSGKSSFSLQLAQAFEEDFTADQIAFSGEEYMKKATELEPYSVMILDEGIESLFSRNAMKKENKKLVQFFRQCRELNLFHVINMPSYSELDKSIRQSRVKTVSRCLNNVYKAEVYGRKQLSNIEVDSRGDVSWGDPAFRQAWRNPEDASPELWQNYIDKKNEKIQRLSDLEDSDSENVNYVSTGTAAEMLDVSGDTIRRYCDKGKFNVKKLPNGDRRIPKNQVEEVLN
jgi:hypothetical protein